MIPLDETNNTGYEGHRGPEAASSQDFFAVSRNQMEERNLRTRLGSIDLEEKRALRRLSSEKRLLKIKQEKRLGSLTCRRNSVNGGQINNSGSSTPLSAGTPCQFDSVKLQFKADKRRHLSSTDSVESPGTTKGTSPSTLDEFAQPSPRLPKLPLVNSVESAEPLKITKPLNSISKNNDPFAGDKKPPWTSAIPLRSQSKSEVAKSMDELICRHSDAKYAQNIAVLGEKPSGTRLKRQTWCGKSPPEMQTLQPLTQRKNSYSDNFSSLRNQETNPWASTVTNTTDISQIQTDDRKAQDFLVNKFNRLTRTAYPVVEDVLPRKTLTVPNFPLRNSNSASSLRSFESLPPVFEDRDFKSDTEEEEIFEEAQVVPVGRKESLVLPSDAASMLRQRRTRTLRRQESLKEDDSSIRLPSSQTQDTTQSLRDGEESSGVSGKLVDTTDQSSHGLKSKNLVKNSSLEKKRLSVGSISLSSATGPSFRKDTGQKTMKKRGNDKECVKSKSKQVLEKDTESNEKNVTTPISKANWLKALHKVFNMNMFLNGMTALQKQREVDRLATEKKKAALEQLYEELKNCRYLRMPSKEDEEPCDCVSWVFDKN